MNDPAMHARPKTLRNVCDFSPWVENAIKLLIVYSVVMYFLEIDIEKSPDSTHGSALWLWSERIVALLFTVEFALRLRARGSNYPYSRLGIIDLVAILPFWAGFAVPPAALHYVRTLRILRLFKFYRYSKAMRSFVAGLVKARERLAGMGMVVLILLMFGAVGMYEIEGTEQPDKFGTLMNAFWWTTVTLTTVGYGDAFPVTVLGKLFAQVIMVLGLGITAAFIGIVGQSVYDELVESDAESSSTRG
ncbi:MAG: ion transporter [Planctomycetaceae bacterium]|nr:ion transporter [Planctomycetales bacterium]MCB9921573.1 ion transporter [Planctomycetaceae bacterium]